MGKLTVLNLRRNNFSGSLPLLCTQSTSLTTIVLNNNQLEGSVLVSLLNCVGLKVLDLGNNAINDTFPAWLGTLEDLQKFLETSTIDLSSNHFEGDIPKSLKDLSSLRLLNLSHNNLKGDIPMELGQLNTLEALDLSWNRLTGKIPQELTIVNFLAFLNLSQNHLVGRIPQGSQFSTFENDSYGGNLDLCGPPLSKQCGTSDSSHVPQPLEEEEEDKLYFFSGFTWESVVIGYNYGLVVGTVMWSLMFKYRKPKWFVEFFEGIFPKKMRRPKKRAQRRRT
ncbi:receptor-like protein 9DC3 [Solanum stenotomum]|uniref:receptor-like protein 9DC3 n=1 Tax=Solanum stenotomum TaxID=172797 RepID=UPI0020CFFCEE|nr:receptor-like protein 9DC3 [Solanum stenotomum]